MKPIGMLLGPSGVGKTTVCQYAEEHLDWLWIELDRSSGPRDRRHDHLPHPKESATGFFTKLRIRINESDHRGALISCPSTTIIGEPVAAQLAAIGVHVIYLCGSTDLCIERFLQREAATGRNLTLAYWNENNADMLRFQESLRGDSSIKRVAVHDDNHEPLSPKQIVDLIGLRLAAAPPSPWSSRTSTPDVRPRAFRSGPDS